MGNNHSTDPLKCTRDQLQQLINSAITHSPGVDDHSRDRKNKSEAEQLKALKKAVELMKVKGR